MAAQSEVAKLTNEELLKAQAHIWNHIFGFITSMSLKAAIQLQIPDAIHRHGKSMTLSQLADSLAINKAKTQHLRRLMRILTHSNFFTMVRTTDFHEEEEEEEAYGLTTASLLLVQDEPMSLSSFALGTLESASIRSWHCLAEWFRDNYESAFEREHGMPLWECAMMDQRWNLLFNECMASDSRLVIRVLAEECGHVFEGLTSMVDVGGGTGTVAMAVAEKFPDLKCTVLDLPHVVSGLKDEHNVNFVGGDMFKSIPQADAVLLKWILHDWKDEDCVKILQRCKEAIVSSNGSEGKVIIVENVVKEKGGDEEALKTQLLFDMLMMVEQRGKERTEKEWARLFVDSGFTGYKIHPVLGLRAVIEVFP